MATYVNNLRLTELATGEGSGTWGTTTNTSLELIGEALGYNTQNCFSSDADATTTVADGASDPARSFYFKVTSSATLSATRTLTIAPNTLSRVMFIENATTGSQSIAISQGSGANVTIATGKTAVVYLDGAGSTAAVVDAMAGVDPGITDTLAEVLVAGNTSGGTNVELTTTDKVQFRDTAIYLNSSADGQLDIVADTEVQIAATTIDINGNVDISGTAGVGGVLTANAGVVVDNITIDGQEIDVSSGDLTLDVAGDIILDTGGDDIKFKVGGTDFGSIAYSNSNLLLTSAVSNGDILLKGNDGGSTITALTLDMSDNGNATFSNHVQIGDGKAFIAGADNDFQMYHLSGANILQTIVSDADMTFKGNDGGSTITALTLDMSAAGAATFNSNVILPDNSYFLFGDTTSGIQGNSSSDFIKFYTANTSRFQIASDGAATFGSTLTTGGDFLAESSASIDSTIRATGNNTRALGNYQAHTSAGADINMTLGVFGDASRGEISTATNHTLRLYVNNTPSKYLEIATTGQIFTSHGLVVNEDSNDSDFRVESDSQTHAFFVDASANRIGINQGNPNAALDIITTVTAGADALRLKQPASSEIYQIQLGVSGQTNNGLYIRNTESTGQLQSWTSGEVVINDDSVDRDFRVESNGSTHMLFVDAGNNRIGINDTSPDFKLDLLGGNGDQFRLNNGGERFTQMYFAHNNVSKGAIWVDDTDSSFAFYGYLGIDANFYSNTQKKFSLRSSEVVVNEDSLDIDFRVESDNYSHAFFVQASNGRVNIGDATVPNQALHISTNANTTEPMGVNDSGANGAVQKHRISFKYQTTEVGSIKANNSATTFNTSSDARLKENIVDADDAGELIDGIQVRQFDWIVDGEHQRYGMVAQELNTVAPEAVSEGVTEEDMMGVDYSKLVPMLVKEIQSLRARVAQLENT